MKKVIISLISLCMLISLSNQAVAQDKGKETVVFSVSMHCNNCEKKIKENIRFEKGVTKINTDLNTQTVTITFKRDKITKEKLAAALKKLGYEVTEIIGTEIE